MNAKICDRCGILWKDTASCKIEMKYVIISKGNSHSDIMKSADLCGECYNGLFDYLKPIPITVYEERETNKI